MIKLIDKINKRITVYFNKTDNEKVAAYLYCRDVCIEKIMYLDCDQVSFSEDIQDDIIYYVVGYKRDINTKKIIKSDKSYFYFSDGNIINIKKEVLFENDNVLIKAYSQESNITFITFLGTKTTKKTKPFALNFVIENGWNCISVHQDNDTQYQDLSEQQFYDSVIESIEK